MSIHRYDLGVIGAGNMAEAIVRGVIARRLLKPDQIIAADPSPPLGASVAGAKEWWCDNAIVPVTAS